MATGKQLKVNCPKCELEFNYYDSKFRPFCSERCKDVDLGHWFSESYKVHTKEQLNEEDLQKVISNLEDGEENHE